jgi:hypothetical protein
MYPRSRLRKPRGPLAVKIDTRGSESFVINGGRKTLAQAELLILEFWPYGVARMGGNVEDIISCLQNFATVTIAEDEGGDVIHQQSHPTRRPLGSAR